MLTLEYDLRKTKILSKFISLKKWFESRDYRSYDHDRTQGLAWNIKVHNNDETGHSGSEKINSKYDKLWERYLKGYECFFDECCEDGLGFVGDAKYRQYDWNAGIPEIEAIDYDLAQAGRSGGWLILSTFDGGEVSEVKDNIESFIYRLETHEADGNLDLADELLDETENNNSIDLLEKLKIFCDSLDKFNATQEWNHQCSFRRYNLECEWDNKNFDCFDANNLVELYEDDAIDDSIKKSIFNYWNIKYQLKLAI